MFLQLKKTRRKKELKPLFFKTLVNSSCYFLFLINQSIGKYLGPRVQETFSSVSTLGMAFYNGWKMTLVVLAGLPVIGLANRIQQNEADATVEPEGVEAVSV